jgi:hypothetical protein
MKRVIIIWIYLISVSCTALNPPPTPTSTATPTRIPISTETPIPTITPSPTPIYPPVDEFVGIWKNIDPNTRGWTKLEIGADGKSISFHLWGACIPTDCDAGIHSTEYLGNPVKIYIDFGFATEDMTFLLEDEILHLEEFVHFRDDEEGSDWPFEPREDQLNQWDFKK